VTLDEMAAVFRGNALLLLAWIDAGVSEAECFSIAVARWMRLPLRMFTAAVRVANSEETVMSIAAFAL
jgi:hypothetical protein